MPGGSDRSSVVQAPRAGAAAADGGRRTATADRGPRTGAADRGGGSSSE
jgi:hypothetical protein